MRLPVALALLLMVLVPGPTAAAGGVVHEVSVARARLRLDDVLPQCAPAVAELDLGPAPAPGGTRLVTRDELRRVFVAAAARPPAWLPEAVRVVRKMQKLLPADVEALARRALDGTMPRGATLTAVRPPRSAEVAAGWDAVRAALPRPPHRTGPFPTVATLTFAAGAEIVTTLSVPVDLTLSAEAALYDLARGSTLTLVVRYGLVEIEAPALATADADLGAIVAVTLRASGRVVRARLVAKDRAELVEGGGT